MIFRFLQTSDWHLGVKLSSLPETIADSRRRSAIETLIDILRQSMMQNINAILLPGDLFDNVKPSYSLKTRVSEILAVVPDSIPVYVIPGTHDHYIEGGLWDDPLFSRLNVFKKEGFSSFNHPELPVTIWGVPVLKGNRDKNWFQEIPELDRERANILLYHGDYRGTGREYENWDYPFVDEDLQNSGFDYIALGHHHGGKLIEFNGSTKAGYSGSPFGWTFRKSETGDRTYIIGEINQEQNKIEQVLIDGPIMFNWEIDLTKPSEAEDIIEDIKSLRGKDFARVTILGDEDPMNLREETRDLDRKFSNVLFVDKTDKVAVISETENIHLSRLIHKLQELREQEEIDADFHRRLVERARWIFS